LTVCRPWRREEGFEEGEKGCALTSATAGSEIRGGMCKIERVADGRRGSEGEGARNVLRASFSGLFT
jgi:hypothetical protein